MLVTIDAGLPHQQDLGRLPLAIVLLIAPSNRLDALLPLVPGLLEQLSDVSPDQVHGPPSQIDHRGRDDCYGGHQTATLARCYRNCDETDVLAIWRVNLSSEWPRSKVVGAEGGTMQRLPKSRSRQSANSRCEMHLRTVFWCQFALVRRNLPLVAVVAPKFAPTSGAERDCQTGGILLALHAPKRAAHASPRRTLSRAIRDRTQSVTVGYRTFRCYQRWPHRAGLVHSAPATRDNAYLAAALRC